MARKLLCIVLIYALLVTACAMPPGPSASVHTGEVAASSGDPCAGWEACARGEVCAVDLGACFLANDLAQAVKAFPIKEHLGPKVVATAPFYDAVVAERIQAIARRIRVQGEDPVLKDDIRKLTPQLIPEWLPSIQAALISRLRTEFRGTGIALREAQLDEILAEQQLWQHPDFQQFLRARLRQLRDARFLVLGTTSRAERKFSRVNATVVYVETGEVLAAPEAKFAGVKKPCVWCWVLGVLGVLAAGAIAAIAISGGGGGKGGAGG